MAEPYLTSHRVARILEISKRTLHNWVRTGKIPSPPVDPKNGYLLWTTADIETIRMIRKGEAN